MIHLNCQITIVLQSNILLGQIVKDKNIFKYLA